MPRFRWIYCQLETLSRCFPPSIRRALDELPVTLDETYERALKEIDKGKRDYANRLFHCLVVSIRPLRVEELAELFAIIPKADSTPEFNIGWRPQDPEEFILSTCTTLVYCQNRRRKGHTILTFLCERIFDLRSYCGRGTRFTLPHSPSIGTYSSR